jgi:hypothetical protein
MFSMRPRVKRALLGVLCAFMLFAQHAALSHAVWHASQQAPAHEHDLLDSDPTHAPHAPELSRLCAFDAAFGQVLGGAPPSSHFLAPDTAVSETAVHAHRVFVAVDFLAPRSRGPPSLL